MERWKEEKGRGRESEKGSKIANTVLISFLWAWREHVLEKLWDISSMERLLCSHHSLFEILEGS
jgi:hypothetical protein